MQPDHVPSQTRAARAVDEGWGLGRAAPESPATSSSNATATSATTTSIFDRRRSARHGVGGANTSPCPAGWAGVDEATADETAASGMQPHSRMDAMSPTSVGQMSRPASHPTTASTLEQRSGQSPKQTPKQTTQYSTPSYGPFSSSESDSGNSSDSTIIAHETSLVRRCKRRYFYFASDGGYSPPPPPERHIFTGVAGSHVEREFSAEAMRPHGWVVDYGEEVAHVDGDSEEEEKENTPPRRKTKGRRAASVGHRNGKMRLLDADPLDRMKWGRKGV